MKILWVHSHFGFGGGPKTILTWAIGLRELGHDISFIGHGGRLLDSVIENNFNFIHLPNGKFRPSISYACKIYKLGKTINPDVIISVGIHSSMEASFAACLLKKPILFIFNLSPRDRLWISNKKWQFPQISDMVVVNQELKDICVNNYGWDSDKIHHIPERIFPQKILCKKKDTIESIAIIRRLDNVKCVPVIKFMDRILSFLQGNKNVSINIIGEGEGYEKVQVKSNAINSILDRQAVKCTGYIDDIDKKLHNFDLIIGTEKVVVESLLFRKPTAILNNNGELIPITMANVKDLSNNNFTGSHYDSLTISSVEDIINKIESLIEDEISALGQWIENSFSYKIGVSKISILLEKISSPKHFIKKFFFQLIKMYGSIFVNLLRKTVK